MSRHGPWRVLGIEPTDDLKTIRRAYADKLKAMDVDREAAQFAELRNARDHALHLARSMAAPPEPVEEDEWSLGFTDFEEAEEGEFDRDARWSSPAGIDAGAIAPEPLQPAEPGPDILLQELLFPGGQHSDEGFAYEEFEAALGHMRQIIANALEGELGLQRMSDYWLADRLAAAWPRSAPLVIEAAEAFEWERQAGMLGEGAAQAFLNARLRGMRFHAKAQQPDHWAHAAWQELSKPGPKRWLERSKAAPADVKKLIGGIREHFPEVESFLDPERVRSWEKKSDDNPWRVVVPILIGVLLLFRVIAMFAPEGSGSSNKVDPPLLTDEAVSNEDARNFLVKELFGPEATFQNVLDGAPSLATLISKKSAGVEGEIDQEIAADEVAVEVRLATLAAAPDAAFEELVRIDGLKLELARLAQNKSGSQACLALLTEGRLFPSVVPPPDLREKERALAFALLGKKLLEPPLESRPVISAMIPGEVITAARRASGVSDETVDAVLQKKGSDKDQCAFRLALLDEVLRRPGSVSADVLKVL